MAVGVASLPTSLQIMKKHEMEGITNGKEKAEM
jgi:hypothetical protein